MKQKQFIISKRTLYIVATPIGNLSEITERALEVLRGVDLIACEDTRHTLKLLTHYGIAKPLTAYHKHNERDQSDILIERLDKGASVALVTDAGMPVISDPGSILINKAKDNGIDVTVISGATALINALVLSGMSAERFSFIGFLPERKKDRDILLADYVNLPSTLIFYASPYDIKENIAYLAATFGDRKLCIIKELTKIHESAVTATLKNPPDFEPKGEYVLVVEGGVRAENPFNALTIPEHLAYYKAQGLSKMDAAKKVAADRKLSKSEIYKYTHD